jgi:AcrR family transcriptional regulator
MPPIDDTQKRLLEAAGPVFAAKGFAGATVREICHRAEANLAAVNYYFRDKERLYIETVKSALDCQAESVPPPSWPAGTPASVKLRDFIKMLLQRMFDARSPDWHRQLILRELAQPTTACTELVQERIRPLAEMLAQLIAELLPDVSELRRHLIAFSIVGQCFYHRVARPVVEILVGKEEFQTYDQQLLAEHITRFSLAALGFEKPIGHATDSEGPTSPKRTTVRQE